jgi:hypothetical protein
MTGGEDAGGLRLFPSGGDCGGGKTTQEEHGPDSESTLRTGEAEENTTERASMASPEELQGQGVVVWADDEVACPSMAGRLAVVDVEMLLEFYISKATQDLRRPGAPFMSQGSACTSSRQGWATWITGLL